MSFYEMFNALCKNNGTSVTAVVTALGMSRGLPTYWKTSGSVPSYEILYKIADYFNISVDELLNGKQKESVKSDSELDEILQAVRDNPSLKMLFSASKNATAEDINRTVAILERLKGTNNDL